jgi:RNA polymerase sigma factor (sigma-70 family)
MERPPTFEEVDRSPVRLPARGVDGFIESAYEAHHAEVYGFLARATRDPSLAEDLLQETFLRLTNEVRAGRAPDQVRGWLFRVASNLTVSRARRNSVANAWRGRYGPAEHASLVDESPEIRVLRRERTNVIEAALMHISADARVALLLSSQGFTGEEIAETIGRSHGATRTLLTRARIQVRQILSGEDVR